MALLGKAKEARCLNKVETRISETSGPCRTTAGPANKPSCSQTTTLPVSMAKDYKISREVSKRSKSVPISSEGESNVTSPSLQTSGFSGILSPSSLGSPTPFQTLTKLSNTPSSVEQWGGGGGGGVSGHIPPRSPSTGGTPVADQQHETGEWECNMPCNDRDDDHLRRLKNGVECHITKPSSTSMSWN